MIKIWNYYKTPSRGVRNFGLLVDDLLVYSGVLPQHDSHTRGVVPGLNPPGVHHTILFTDNEEIALKVNLWVDGVLYYLYFLRF